MGRDGMTARWDALHRQITSFLNQLKACKLGITTRMSTTTLFNTPIQQVTQSNLLHVFFAIEIPKPIQFQVRQVGNTRRQWHQAWLPWRLRFKSLKQV